MSEASGCSGNCSSCSSKGSCSKPQSLLEPANHLSEVKKVIGIVSGKGGVGKSMVTSSLAVMMQRRGFSTAILDADITGPSIPKMFGITGRAQGTELGIDPRLTSKGTEVMSVNLLLENTDDPVVWRGPVIAGTVKQFWSDVVWGEVDYMFIDMPPGTGDVPLTVYQSLPLDAIIGMYQAINPNVNGLLNCLLVFNLPFTFFKGMLDAVICFAIYKPLSPILHGRNSGGKSVTA